MALVSDERTREAVVPQFTPIYCAGWPPLSRPDAPMGRLHGDVLSRIRVDPSAEDPAARKDHPVN